MTHGVNISALLEQRTKLRKALSSLDDMLRSLGVDPSKRDPNKGARITLAKAIKTVCAQMKNNITKAAILDELRRSFPELNPNAQSVAAALAKLTHGGAPFLYVADRGAGNRPTVYTTDRTWISKLLPSQLETLFDPRRTNGTGGWQSLFKRLQNRTDRETGEIILDRTLLLSMRHYFFHYGVGGWQSHLKSIFGTHMPELFRKPQKNEFGEDELPF